MIPSVEERLRRAAQLLEADPLPAGAETEYLSERPTRRRGWAVAAAAVVVVLLVGGLAVGSRRSGGGPASGTAPTWTPMATSPLSPRHEPLVADVGNALLVAGGRDTPACPPNADCESPAGAPLRDAALYDPVVDSWMGVPDAPVGVTGLSATATAGSTVWSLQRETPTPALVAFDASARRWEVVPVPADSGNALAATDTSVLIYDTSYESGVSPDRLYDPSTGAWTDLPPDPIGRAYDRSFVAVRGELVLLGIPVDTPTPPDRPRVFHAARFTPATGAWTPLPPSEIAGYATEWHAHGGQVTNPTLGSADGGEVNGWDRAYPFGGILDLDSQRWLPLPPAMDVEVGSGSNPIASNDQWVVTVVAQAGTPVAALDLASTTWASLPPLPTPLPTGAGRGIAANHLIIWGGADFSNSPRGQLTNVGQRLELRRQ